MFRLHSLFRITWPRFALAFGAAVAIHIGAEAAAEEEQSGGAARFVDGVKPGVRGRNREISCHGLRD